MEIPLKVTCFLVISSQSRDRDFLSSLDYFAFALPLNLNPKNVESEGEFLKCTQRETS